ncbi:MAG: alpha/beta fold hydrolase [Acidobacteria bacterium]|nr:MAG: alpha/beta fold hydrolase [Acidobacteriota bacterium]
MSAKQETEAQSIREVTGEPVRATLKTNRGLVEYATLGEGPAVLALHGAMGGYDQSVILARTIGEAGYRFLCVSRPGYLGTPLASGRTSEEQADLCAALLDQLGVRAAAAMAVSGGGPCAIQFALRHPGRCWALVLVSTCSGRILGGVPFAFHIMKMLARLPGFEGFMARRAERDPEGAARRSIPDPVVRSRTLQDPVAGPLLAALTRSTLDRMASRLPGTENDIAITRTTDYPLERLAVPLLVVHGTADRIVPFSPHAEAFERRVPGAQLLAIPAGEHVTIFTHRAEVRERVTGFLRKHVPAVLA